VQSFTTHRGLVVPLDRFSVDTDQLVSKEFLKRVERTGFGQFLFYHWRFDATGEPIPTFPLNQPQYEGASILVSGPNFGAGSSREHAVWALQEFGFRAVIAPSFADIFYNNCLKNGLLPVPLAAEVVAQIMTLAAQPYWLTVDLHTCQVTDGQGLTAPFAIDQARRHDLLHGLDEIARTLQLTAKIAAYEAAQ
jgi:3-isopropylmalate/(R)-2-methylmalate dehydratase small subunit